MTAFYNDNDPFCCRVLRKQIAAGNLPQGFVDERDIREVTAADLAGYQQIHLFAGIGGFPLGFRWAGVPDDFSVITGGFPCQDISTAGKRAGIDGERSGLWREYARIIRAFRPDYVVMENVAALRFRGLDIVLRAMAEIGFDAEWSLLSAAAFGLPQARDRMFVVAHRDGLGREACRRVFDRDAGRRVREEVGVMGRLSRLERGRSGRIWAVPDAGIHGMADGISAVVDGGLTNGIEVGTQEGRPEGISDNTAMPAMWLDPSRPAASSRPCETAGNRLSLPVVPHGGGQAPRQVGRREEATEVVQGLRQGIHPEPLAEALDLQPGMPVRNRTTERDEAMASDRLRALGNAIVPQVAELIGRRLMEIVHA